MLLMERGGPVRKRNPSRARDLLLYVAISMAVVVLIMVCAHIGINGDILFRWIGFAAFSLLVFGYFVSGSRPQHEMWTFWALTAAALENFRDGAPWYEVEKRHAREPGRGPISPDDQRFFLERAATWRVIGHGFGV